MAATGRTLGCEQNEHNETPDELFALDSLHIRVAVSLHTPSKPNKSGALGMECARISTYIACENGNYQTFGAYLFSCIYLSLEVLTNAIGA